MVKGVNLETPSKSTLASSVYNQIRDDLLQGVIQNEKKLRVEWVVGRYGAGASPVREALNRLASEGLLDRHDQRGFALKPLSARELEELTRTRCWLEEQGLRESIANRTQQWEEHLVLALHRLVRASGLVRKQPSSLDPDWERAHLAFHRALIAACKSHWLVTFCNQLTDQARRYRLLAQPNEVAYRNCMTEHRLIAEAALDGDADRAVAALVNHYVKSASVCRALLK